jgi:hypothetical protein
MAGAFSAFGAFELKGGDDSQTSCVCYFVISNPMRIRSDPFYVLIYGYFVVTEIHSLAYGTQ